MGEEAAATRPRSSPTTRDSTKSAPEPASTVGTYAYVNPVVAVALGALLLGERLSPGLLVGGSLIVIAVLLSTLRPARR